MKISLTDKKFCPMAIINSSFITTDVQMCMKHHCAAWIWSESSSESGIENKYLSYSVDDVLSKTGVNLIEPQYPDVISNDVNCQAWNKYVGELISIVEVWTPHNPYGIGYELIGKGFDDDEYSFYASFQRKCKEDERFGYCGMVPRNNHTCKGS